MVQLALCACPDEATAKSLATGLVEKRLAACVNLVPDIISVYRWEGQVQQDAEVLLLIKTTQERFPELRDYLVDAHPYELPEVIAVSIAEGFEPYLQWVAKAVGRYGNTD